MADRPGVIERFLASFGIQRVWPDDEPENDEPKLFTVEYTGVIDNTWTGEQHTVSLTQIITRRDQDLGMSHRGGDKLLDAVKAWSRRGDRADGRSGGVTYVAAGFKDVLNNFGLEIRPVQGSFLSEALERVAHIKFGPGGHYEFKVRLVPSGEDWTPAKWEGFCDFVRPRCRSKPSSPYDPSEPIDPMYR